MLQTSVAHRKSPVFVPFRDTSGTEIFILVNFCWLYLYLYSKLKKLKHYIFYCDQLVRRFGIIVKADWVCCSFLCFHFPHSAEYIVGHLVTRIITRANGAWVGAYPSKRETSLFNENDVMEMDVKTRLIHCQLTHSF